MLSHLQKAEVHYQNKSLSRVWNLYTAAVNPLVHDVCIGIKMPHSTLYAKMADMLG